MKLVSRWIRFIIGILIVGIGIVLTIKAGLGVSPWSVFHIGLTKYLNLTVGRVGQLTGVVIILVSFLLGRKPTFGTLLNILLIGFIIDWMMLLISKPNNLFMQYLYLILGIFVFGLGAGLYISAQCGTGPRDGLMMALDSKFDFDIGWVRSGIETVVLIIGYLLGGPIGIGTLLIALGIGPVVSISLKVMNKLFNSSSLSANY